MNSNAKWLNWLGIGLLAIAVFAAGFYYGFRYHQANARSVDLTGVQSVAESLVHTETVAKEVEGVFWIRPNQDPVCPEDHPIKVKFDSGVCFYYTKDNKAYGRVKPHVCLATEQFAQQQVGCIKKF